MSLENDGGKPERKIVSTRMPVGLIEGLDEFAWQHRTDRSDVIERACLFFLQGITCPECGTLNAKGSKQCSICQRDFIADNRWLDLLEFDVNYVIRARHNLGEILNTLEKSYLELVDRENAVEKAGKVDKLLALQTNETSLLVKEVQNVTNDSEKNAFLKNIREAEVFLRSPDMKEVPEIAGKMSRNAMGLANLMDEVERLLAYNKKFLETLDEE